MTRAELFAHIADTYSVVPDYPFEEDFVTAVLRHKNTRKWYAIVMEVSRRKFGFDSDEPTDAVNMKLPVEMFGSFGKEDGVYPAYHMNKDHWLTVALHGIVDDEKIKFLIDMSYDLTKGRKR